jgi:hypothetical protein
MGGSFFFKKKKNVICKAKIAVGYYYSQYKNTAIIEILQKKCNINKLVNDKFDSNTS